MPLQEIQLRLRRASQTMKSKWLPTTQRSIHRLFYQSEGLRDPFRPLYRGTDQAGQEEAALCETSRTSIGEACLGVTSPVAVIEAGMDLATLSVEDQRSAPTVAVWWILGGRVLVRERLQDQLGRISIVDRTLSLRTTTGRPGQSDDDDLSESSTPDGPLSASTPDAELEAIEDEEEDEDSSDDEDLEVKEHHEMQH